MKLVYSLILTAATMCTMIHAQITQISTMQEISGQMMTADEHTLALFDIDMVLIQPEEPAFQMANMKLHGALAKKILFSLPEEKKDVFWNLMHLSSHAILIDPQSVTLFSHLKERKVPTMALTGNLTGKLSHIANMEEFKSQRLISLGIDFSQEAPWVDEISFSELPSYRNYYCRYQSGILFVNGSCCSKGEALVAFLKRTGISPRKVIFIDDREDNLKSVESSLQKFDPSLAFIGLHYTGAKDYPSALISAEQFENKWQNLAKEALKTE